MEPGRDGRKSWQSRPAIANSMRLLSLPTEVQQEVSSGNLPAGQARALLGLHSEPLILSAYREVLAKGLSTRETEKLVRHLLLGRRRRRQVPLIDPDLRSIVEELQRLLGTRVRLLPKARSARGKIESYYSLLDLDRIIQTIKNSPTPSLVTRNRSFNPDSQISQMPRRGGPERSLGSVKPSKSSKLLKLFEPRGPDVLPGSRVSVDPLRNRV